MFDCAIHSPTTHVQFAVADGSLSLDGEMLESPERSVAWPHVGPYRWSLASHLAGRQPSIELTNQATMIRDGTGRRIHTGESVTVSLPRQIWMGNALVELIPTSLPEWLNEALVRLPSNLDMKESAQWDPELIGEWHATKGGLLMNLGTFDNSAGNAANALQHWKDAESHLFDNYIRMHGPDVDLEATGTNYETAAAAKTRAYLWIIARTPFEQIGRIRTGPPL